MFEGGDANLYSYAGNDPVNRIDPTGLDWTDTALDLLEDVSNGFSGFANTVTLGLTGAITDANGGGGVNKCSVAYAGGEIAGMAFNALGIPSGAGISVWARSYPNAKGVGIGVDRFGKNLVRIDWHRIGKGANVRNLPHIDIPGIVKHWPWK